jgi:predicted transcriptional regulator
MIDPEDLEQELVLLQLQARAEEEVYWSHNFRCKVISFIRKYDTTPTVSYDEEALKTIDFEVLGDYIKESTIYPYLHIGYKTLNTFQRQLAHLHITDGLSINELAKFYHADRKTVRLWLKEIYSTLRMDW